MSDPNRSSAVPGRLFEYAQQTEQIQTGLVPHAQAVGTAIGLFQETCTEYYVALDGLGWDLNAFITHDNNLSRWTRAVGFGFIFADQGLWNISIPSSPDALNAPGSHIEIIDLDERTQLLNLIEWAKSLLEGGNLTDEQRQDLEDKIAEAENALAAKAEDTGNDQYAAAGVMVVGAGALVADDVTVVGVVDDVAIPFVLVAAGAVALWGVFTQWGGVSPDEQISNAISQMNSESSSAEQPEESKDFLGQNDPNSWAGEDAQDIEDAIPDDWIKSPANKGGGTKYSNPGRPGEQIIIEPGWPNATDPTHAGPYVKVSTGGKVIRIPLKGNPALGGP
jgi:hypothetical protein